MNWKDFLACALVGIPLAVVAFVVIGMGLEGYAKHSEQIDICRKRAETPAEYHRC